MARKGLNFTDLANKMVASLADALFSRQANFRKDRVTSQKSEGGYHFVCSISNVESFSGHRTSISSNNRALWGGTRQAAFSFTVKRRERIL